MLSNILTPYIMDHKSILNPIVHADLLCSTIIVKIADWAPPIRHIHVVNDHWAGYLFNVYACIHEHCLNK